MRLFLIIALAFSLLTFGGFSYLSFVAEHSHGISRAEQRFEVRSGEDIFSLARRLSDAELIASRPALLWYLVRAGQTHNPIAPEAVRLYAQCLYENGVKQSDLERLMVQTPSALLGIG